MLVEVVMKVYTRYFKINHINNNFEITTEIPHTALNKL